MGYGRERHGGTAIGCGLVALLVLTGCTPAGMAPVDDSFSIQTTAEPEKATSADDRTIVLGGKLKLDAPEHWVSKTPVMQMIAYEFAVPAVEGDAQDCRVTVMSAGGSADANVARWIGQFSQPDGSATKDKAKTETNTIAGQEVRLVDLSGTYHDSRGPMTPTVERPDYRMLAAIIPTAEGNYFIKFYGPRKTVDANAVAFEQMIQGLKP